MLLHRIPVGRQYAAVKAVGQAASLHSFQNSNVFKVKGVPVLDDCLTGTLVLLTARSITNKVETDRFPAAFCADRRRDQGHQLVRENLKREIRKEYKPVTAVFLVLW